MKRKSMALILLLAFLVGLLGAFPVQAEEIPDVTQYSYTVTPILSPFAYYLYVQTDNPDPTSFLLVDKESRFRDADDYGEDECYCDDGYVCFNETDLGIYYVSTYLYPDVVYEDESTYRVAGGYIFRANMVYSDGGELVLLQKTHSGESVFNSIFKETDVTIPCQTLHTQISYLIDTCTTSEMSFFEKLDAVQARLNQISVYPRSVYDSSKPNESRPYPFLAASPYPELWLNAHYDMFDYLESGMLAAKAYPFILDSQGVPGMMRTVAKELEPDCVTASGSSHSLTNITFEGETRQYGGAGAGGNDPLFSEDVQKVFTFQGESDFGTHGTIEGYRELLLSYRKVASEGIEQYQNMISGDVLAEKASETGGTWIQVATESFGYGTSFAYVAPQRDSYFLVSDAWVDGRYISNREIINLNQKFEDHPTAGIVLPNVTFTDYYGETITQEVVYTYDETLDVWAACEYYAQWTASPEILPDELILTREEVEQLDLEIDLDRNSRHWPESGLIYDGTVYPGTPFTMTLVNGISIPETLELGVGMETTLVPQLEPAEASDQTVVWSSSDDTVLQIPNPTLGFLRGISEGTVVLTAVSVDGGFKDQCTVTVVDYCKNGHTFTSYVSDENATCTENGTKTAKCDFCEATDTIADEGTALGHEMGEWYSMALPNCIQMGVEERQCTRCDECELRLVDATGHTAEEWTTDENRHWHVCDCGEVFDAAQHTYADDADAECDICGYTRTVVVLGNVDGNDSVDYFDGMTVMQYFAGIIDETQLDITVADVDNSGSIDFFDAMYILQYFAGIVEKLPVEA